MGIKASYHLSVNQQEKAALEQMLDTCKGADVNPTEHRPREGEIRSTFASTTGGVMTKEAGAVTGDLEISTRAEGDALGVSVRYTGAEEWYTVEGSPISLSGTTPPSPDELGELHQRVLGNLRSPGRVVNGNELYPSPSRRST